MDPYKTLGITKNATEEEIKQAYRRLAMKYHPDRNQGDKAKEEMFKDIQKAYDMLSNAKTEYDTQDHSPFSRFTQTNDFADIFGEYFQKTYAEKPKSIAVELTFWEAVFGVKKSYSTTLTHQSGKKSVDEFDVSLPSGVSDGDQYTVRSPAGHEYMLKVSVPEKSQDKLYTRDGNDLYTILSISFTTAILGRKYLFKHWDSDLEITIPPGIQSGQKLRLKSKGIKAEPKFGDLYVEVRVENPKNLTKEQKDLIMQLEKHFPFKDNIDKVNESWVSNKL